MPTVMPAMAHMWNKVIWDWTSQANAQLGNIWPLHAFKMRLGLANRVMNVAVSRCTCKSGRKSLSSYKASCDRR